MGEQVFGEYTVVGTWATVTPIYNNNWSGSAALTGMLNDKPEEAVSKALTEADKILKSKKKNGKEENGCRNFLMDKLGLTSEQIDKITNNVRNAPTTFPGTGNVVGPDVVRARVFYPDGRLEIYNGFFKGPPPLSELGGGAASYNNDLNKIVPRSPDERAVDLIHEGIHLLGGDSEYGDIALANKLRNKRSIFTDKKEASEFLDKEIRERCKK
jgi:hypothetical protein